MQFYYWWFDIHAQFCAEISMLRQVLNTDFVLRQQALNGRIDHTLNSRIEAKLSINNQLEWGP